MTSSASGGSVNPVLDCTQTADQAVEMTPPTEVPPSEIPPDEAPPVVCNLTIGRRAERELAWTDIAALALSHEDLADGVRATFPLDRADAIEALADKEIDCCGSWLRIHHERTNEHFQLELTTDNPEGTELIRSFVQA